MTEKNNKYIMDETNVIIETILDNLEKNNKYLIDERTITIEPILDNSNMIENITIEYISENKTIDNYIELLPLSVDNVINSKVEENININSVFNNFVESFSDTFTVNSIESILDDSIVNIVNTDILINETENIKTDTFSILKNDEKYVLKTEFNSELYKFQNKLIELFDKKIVNLKKDLVLSNKLLYEKQNNIDTLEIDLKNKEILLNNNTDIIKDLNVELDELKKKVKQQDIVKLLTKLKSDENKCPIIVMENEELDNKTNVVKFMDESKLNLIKRRKKIF